MNVNRTLHRVWFLLQALLVANTVDAQRQTFRAPLPQVGSSGFYKVVVTPEVTAHSTADLHDVRIRDRQGREVPYLPSADAMIFGQGFHGFPIIRNEKSANGNTLILLGNDAKPEIDALVLKVRNTSATRMASISGSSDNTNFFSLRDSTLLEVHRGNGDTGLCMISLPLTS